MRLIFIILFLFPSVAYPQQLKKWELTKIVDGDTIYAMDSLGLKSKFRLIGIDAPESKHPRKPVERFSHEATVAITELLADGIVYIEYDVQKFDRYKRTLAYLYNSKGVFVNDALIKQGVAVVSTYPPNVKYVDVFTKSQTYARENEIGLWGSN